MLGSLSKTKHFQAVILGTSNDGSVCRHLGHHIGPWMEGTARKHRKKFVFHHDGVAAHAAKKWQEYLTRSVDSFWSKVMWPPSSPDLNHLDLSVYTQIKLFHLLPATAMWTL